MKLLPKGKWIESNTFILVTSILTAALIWVVVAMTVGRPNFVQYYSDVPVNIELRSEEFADLGYNIVETDMPELSARVTGDRIAISSQNGNYFAATVEVPRDLTVSGAGTYSLPLVPVVSDYDRSLYSEISYEPATVSVKIDRNATAAFPVTDVINGLGFEAGYIGGDKTITPPQVNIRGPQAEVSKIDRCVITAELTELLSGDYIEDFPIRVLDAKGEEINLDESHLTIDYAEARLVIEALERVGLALRVDFNYIPRNFPIDELRYSMTANMMEVAAPSAMADKYTELLLGVIDLRTVTLDSPVYSFPIDIPEGYVNLDSINNVTLRFIKTAWDEISFNATGIQLLNVPSDIDVQILSGESINNILFVGRASLLETMTAEDIIMEIDLSEREVPLGESQWPVKISAPGKGLVWAAGEYTAVLQVAKRED